MIQKLPLNRSMKESPFTEGDLLLPVLIAVGS